MVLCSIGRFRSGQVRLGWSEKFERGDTGFLFFRRGGGGGG